MIVTVLIYLFLSFKSYVTAETASFFGGSYISVPLEEAKSTTNIHFRLLTKNPDTILFLAAGKTDYCLIKLVSGRLRVHLNLGAGESTITSPIGLRLDDLTWHQVTFNRVDAFVNLTIDNIHVTREKLPGRFFELNIHYGLFIGGQGEFSELFLGHVNWFRGCLSGLQYNGVHPLSRARHRIGLSEAYDVIWSCASEFHADASKEISFIDDGSFMALPNVLSRGGTRWKFKLKTSSVDCLLMYTTGSGENADFVGAEIINGQVHVILDKGGGPGEVASEVYVADGTWHMVEVEFNSFSVEVTVDNKTAVQKLLQTATRYYDLGDMVYIGGIEMNKRARALGQGLKAADTSLKGCIKSIYIGSAPVGFPQARVTKGLLPECVWTYPCNLHPCINEATCAHRGVNSFVCLCDANSIALSHCIRNDFDNVYDVIARTMQLQILELTPLFIYEGQNTVITLSNINVILDYAKYGVRDSGVIFSTVVTFPPKHGRLAIEVWELKEGPQRFTLLDLTKDKVRYVHDGSESHEDSIYLDLELSPGSGYILPPYLQGQHRFILHVNVTAMNDPPTFTISSNFILKLPQGTRKLLTPSLLNVTDVDSDKSSLIYSVLFVGNGRIERLTNPGIDITTFTQDDIEKKLIAYYHGGPANINTKLTLQVSDGYSSSQPAVLRVLVIPLNIAVVNNSGAFLPHNSVVTISSSNLSITANADDPLLQITLKITEPCEFGVLEKKFNSNGKIVWQSVDEFTYNHLSQNLIRYRHIDGLPVQDKFKFMLSAGEIHVPSLQEFLINFVELNLTEKICNGIYLNGSTEGLLNQDILIYETTPIASLPEKIIYTIKKLPTFGNLYYFKNNVERLFVGDNFTQDDINNNRVQYKMLRSAYVSLNDSLTFVVSVEHCPIPASNEVVISYKPKNGLPHSFTKSINTLKVMEGGRTPILPNELNISVPSVKSLVYEISSGPHHGSLLLVDSIQNITEKNILRFTPSQMAAGRLFYSHDGSETTEDSIEFFAISNVQDDFMIVGCLKVNVNLVNDNPPTRTVSNVFRIVKGGQRVLTTKHIKFEDSDIDFDSVNLVYTIKKGNGVYSSATKTPLVQFTQGELENGKVLIVENGHNESPIYFWVSDGTHITETLLDVRPSPPFVEITNNSHLIVSQGGQATITSSNLFSDTNIDINLGDISYNVLAWPTQGELVISDSANVSYFKQGDIETGKVIYKHSSPSTAQDRIQFKVSVGNIYTLGSLAIRVFPLSYWEPLVVIANETLVVEEFTSVSISGTYLQVKQLGVPPSDINFLVVSGPENGYIDVEGNDEDRIGDYEEKGGIKAFDQSTVNAGKLYYVETVANKTEDIIVIDITNGVTWLRHLLIKIIIVPSMFYLENEEVSVVEGGSVILPLSLFTTTVPYYQNKITDYYLIEEPDFGSIVISPSNKGVNKWTSQQIKGSSIKYIHDGSETTEDTFTVIAKFGKKESEPSKVIVKIIPINDMSPVIVNKTCLKLWQGGNAVLTSEHLAAVDRDTPPENITFVIISASGGHIALDDDKLLSVDKFTQAQINEKKVFVVHDGGKQNFVLETVIVDGKNKYGPITFSTELGRPSLVLRNLGLYMFPRLQKKITPEILNASCTDSRDVFYTIRKHPDYGKLIFDGASEKITNFTQHDVDSLKLSYQHLKSFKNSSLLDFFIFDISADYLEPKVNNVFQINISVFFGGLDQVFDSSYNSLIVDEGGSVPLQINISGVIDILIENIGISQPIIKGILSSFPNHGVVCINEDCNATVFSENQLQSGVTFYQHDHSDTISDSFQVSLYLEPSDVLLNNISFNINILPINDQPFNLITKRPHIDVVHGQEAIITQNVLYTEDLDTDPSGIIYEIVDGPIVGNVYVNNVTSYKFSQSDINNKKVKYRHFGPLESTFINFKVSDGHFDSVFDILNITVSEIKLNISVVSSVQIKQGTNITAISPDILEINTNAKEEDIVFNVTIVPSSGLIYYKDIPILQFTYHQMISHKVFYYQSDMSVSNDTFEIKAFNILNKKLTVILTVNVTVTPYMKIGVFSPGAGLKTKIDLTVLDASLLAKATNTNPTYKIIRKPKCGRLKKIIRTTGEHMIIREKEISKFTHKEVQSNVIYYVAKKSYESIEDKFTFLVQAPPFQPAIGELKFKLNGETPSTTFKPPKLRPPGSKSSSEQDSVQIASPNMSDDYILGLAMVTGTIALALLIVGFVSCGSKQSNYDNSLKSDLPESLPRPPDDISSSPHVGRNATNNSTANIPNKVQNNSLTSSEMELNLRYPYGDEDWNTFGNADNCTDKKKHNPLLRKNQYWV